MKALIGILRQFFPDGFQLPQEPFRHLGALEMGVVDVLDDGLAALQHVGVGQVVEEQHQLVRAGVHIFVEAAKGLIVLTAVAGAGSAPLHAHAAVIGPVVGAPAVVLVAVHAGPIVVVGVTIQPMPKGEVYFS